MLNETIKDKNDTSGKANKPRGMLVENEKNS